MKGVGLFSRVSGAGFADRIIVSHEYGFLFLGFVLSKALAPHDEDFFQNMIAGVFVILLDVSVRNAWIKVFAADPGIKRCVFSYNLLQQRE